MEWEILEGIITTRRRGIPPAPSMTFDENELNEGDPRFWYARGNVVSEFLDKLWQVAWAPIEQEATKQIDFRGRTEKQKQIWYCSISICR